MHRARKSLGQNFLVDPNIQRRIVDAVGASTRDEIVEIGPGLGALTGLLAHVAGRLTAVELDRDLAARLRERWAEHDHVTILESDILETPIDRIVNDVRTTIVVGNIPYNITTPIIFHLLERRNRPARIIIMVQREVADRITAAPGTAEYGALSVGIRTVARVERLFNVSRGCFRPVPGVDSAVLRITPVRPFPLTETEEKDLRTLTAAAFGWRRKQLQKTLRSEPRYALSAEQIEALQSTTGIDLKRRPETLSPEEFVQLNRGVESLP